MTERRGRSRWPAKRTSGSSEKIMDELLKYAVENGNPAWQLEMPDFSGLERP